MGILSDLGPIEDFQETQKQQKQLKIIGIKQFLHRLRLYSTWQKPKGSCHIKWGQQIQGHFLKFNENNELELCKEDISEDYTDLDFPLMFEYGSWMFQMIPDKPYNTNCDFYEIINSIRKKYEILSKKPRIALTIPVIPFMGVRNLNEPINNLITQSKYIDDSHIANHPRFRTLTKHIRMRRDEVVNINVPIYKDLNTNKQELSADEPDPNFIHLDAMAFGMGNSCLQCTFSTKDFDHARYLYDQLNVLSPLLLSLTAGTPFYKGKISDWDVRWKIISGSVDDRSKSERDQNSPDYIPTSRYNESNYYLWDNEINKASYNNFFTGVKEEQLQAIRKIAKEEKVQIDQRMVFHIANIFKRDYLIVHRKFKQMTYDDFLLFEMLNGTNWNSVRLKIPIDDDIGWRVQFRTMEVQLTADQNSAYSLLIHLIIRILHISNELNFYIPISLVRENFERAHKRNSVLTEKFYFRTNIHSKEQPQIAQLTIAEILFGNNNFGGLFLQIQKKIQECAKTCKYVHQVITRIKTFLLETATGKRLTLAQWMRRFVNDHPLYTKNSILPKKVMDDLLIKLHQISIGQAYDENFKRIFEDMDKIINLVV